jgi:hypothetical protein
MKSAIVIITFLSLQAFAGDEISRKSSVVEPQHIQSHNKEVTEDIFNEIMQSIPEDVKSKLDSITAVKSSIGKKQQSIHDDHQKNIENNLRKRDDLPDELKQKIEKAMKDLDNKQARRQIEFKDSKKRQ